MARREPKRPACPKTYLMIVEAVARVKARKAREAFFLRFTTPDSTEREA